MTTTAIIVAAGRGTRAGGKIPKQWQQLGGRTVAAHAIAAFAQHSEIDAIVLVIHPDDAILRPWPDDDAMKVVTGGESRSASVRAGLDAVPLGTTQVLIHDAARPNVTNATITGVLAALETHSAAAPAVPVTDTLWFGADDAVSGTQDRQGLYRAQTPQGFHLAPLRRAYDDFPEATDDVTVARLAGLEVAIVQGDEDNIKITGPDDHARAAADVGMHAVTDAIYGALGRGDIGQHFPPSDPQWKGAASHIFLEHAVALAKSLGFSISNVDCTLVCEYPKIGPHQAAMKAKMAEIMGMDADRISVKATTSERLGFTGRGEGIASIATATLVKS